MPRRVRLSVQGTMSGLYRTVLAVILIAAATAAAADSRAWMGEAAIRAELTNRRLSGIYPNSISWSEEIFTDGTTDYVEAGLRSRGRWTLKGSLFCFKYDQPMMGGCFRMIKIGSNCYELYVEREDGQTPPVPRRDDVAWNGRMWRTAERPTCDDGIS